MAHVHLRDLAIEGRLAGLAEPGRQIGFQFGVGHVAAYGAADIGAQNRALQIVGHAGEGGFVVAHMLHEGRPPGSDRDRIDQQQLAVVAAVDQMRAQRRGAAEIMRDHQRVGQAPMLQQGRQQAVLDTERHILLRALFRLAIAQQVVEMDRVVTGQFPRDVAPDIGGEGRAMDHHQWRAIAKDIVGDFLSPEIEAPRQVPAVIRHVRPSFDVFPTWEAGAADATRRGLDHTSSARHRCE